MSYERQTRSARRMAARREARSADQVEADRVASRHRMAAHRKARSVHQVDADKVYNRQRMADHRKARSAVQVDTERVARQQCMTDQRETRSADHAGADRAVRDSLISNNSVVAETPEPPLSEYMKQVLVKRARNEARIKTLGILQFGVKPLNKLKNVARKKKSGPKEPHRRSMRVRNQPPTLDGLGKFIDQGH